MLDIIFLINLYMYPSIFHDAHLGLGVSVWCYGCIKCMSTTCMYTTRISTNTCMYVSKFSLCNSYYFESRVGNKDNKGALRRKIRFWTFSQAGRAPMVLFTERKF